MNKAIVLVMLAGLVGCSTANTSAHAQNAPMLPLMINCSSVAKAIPQLEYAIANPNESSPLDPTFTKLVGMQSSNQRQASAKTVLWSIRTKCQS